jgi:hypothetical protein
MSNRLSPRFWAFGLLAVLASFPSSADARIRILVIDMPVSREAAANRNNLSIAKDVLPPAIVDQETCSRSGQSLEALFDFLLGKIPSPDLTKDDLAEAVEYAKKIHGDHVAMTVAHGAPGARVESIGVPAFAADDYLNPAFDARLSAIFEEIGRVLSRTPFDLVNVSVADSEAEILHDLTEARGVSERIRTRAFEVSSAWRKQWRALFDRFQATAFVLAAGNGGLDWIGDDLEEVDLDQQTFPATIPAENTFVVGSHSSGVLSRFSNFGAKQVDLLASGEARLSLVPCVARRALRLTGTSQATPGATAWLARQMAAGVSPKKAVGLLTKPSTLAERVRFGLID